MKKLSLLLILSSFTTFAFDCDVSVSLGKDLVIKTDDANETIKLNTEHTEWIKDQLVSKRYNLIGNNQGKFLLHRSRTHGVSTSQSLSFSIKKKDENGRLSGAGKWAKVNSETPSWLKMNYRYRMRMERAFVESLPECLNVK